MRRATVVFLCSLILAACRPAPLQPIATAPVVPGGVPSRPPTLPATQLFFDSIDMMDARSGWAWKGLSQLYRTDDGGKTWNEIHLQGRMLVTGASFLNGQDAWLPGVPSAEIRRSVYHTADGGKTWTKLGTIPGPNVELHFNTAQLGWALNSVGAAGNIFYRAYHTTDGGQTWTELAAAGRLGADQGPMAGSIHTMTGDALALMPPETIWIASGAGIATPYAGLAVSRDGGKAWHDVNPALPAELVKDRPPIAASAPQFVTSEDGFLPVRVGERLVFFASHDGGNSWAILPPVLPAGQMMRGVQFVNRMDGFAVCGPQLCSTQDGGVSWQQIATPFAFGLPAASAFVSQFDFVDGATGWCVLMDRQGSASLLKTTDGGRTWIQMEPRLGF